VFEHSGPRVHIHSEGINKQLSYMHTLRYGSNTINKHIVHKWLNTHTDTEYSLWAISMQTPGSTLIIDRTPFMSLTTNIQLSPFVLEVSITSHRAILHQIIFYDHSKSMSFMVKSYSIH